MKPAFECSCANCQQACERKPGWFLPGEAEALAKAMGIPLEQLFREKLAVDWWAGDNPTFVLSPALKGGEAGTEFPGTNGKCEIHELGKPHECAALTHDTRAVHRDTARAWRRHQRKIRKLLGREPVAAEYTLEDWLFSGLG